jgi:hypothetical protein
LISNCDGDASAEAAPIDIRAEPLKPKTISMTQVCVPLAELVEGLGYGMELALARLLSH